MAAQVALAFIKLVYLIRLKKGIVVWGGGGVVGGMGSSDKLKFRKIRYVTICKSKFKAFLRSKLIV